MLSLTGGSPPLPIFIVLPVILVYFVLVCLVARRVSTSTSFLVITFALRMAMSAQPRLSFASSPAGLSWNALVSVVLVGIGALLLRRSRAVPMVLIPILPLATIVVASIGVNGDPAGGIESLVKYAYFAMIALTAYDAFVSDGADKVLSRLLCTFTLPLVLQFTSLALGIAKANESDGSASFIGGYNHEASFSIILLTGLLAATLHPSMKGRYKLVIAGACIGGILAANYRTAILAAAPLLVGLMLGVAFAAVPPRQRGIAGILAALLLLAAVPAIPPLAGDRFDALSTLAVDPDVLAKPPGDFSKGDREIMSGRLFIWSQYIDAWKNGSNRRQTVGFGANAWEGRYRYYAHNTLVSTLYELGTLGVAGMLLLWGWMLAIAFATTGPLRATLVMAHLGFIVLNMATMPFWMIEGLLYYGLLCGLTIFTYLAARNPQPSVANTYRPHAEPI